MKHADFPMRSDEQERQAISLEDRARLDATMLRRFARDAREGVLHQLYDTQIDRIADTLDALADRAELAP